MPRKTTLLTLPADQPRVSQLILFLLGGLNTLAFAPAGQFWLAPLLLLPLLFICLTLAPRDAGKQLFWFGFGHFLTGTYWIYISVVVFGQAPVWIALFLMLGLVSIMATYYRLAGWLIARLASGEPWLLLLVAPAVWVGIEWLRGWLFSGFPWLALGYSQIDAPLGGWAPVLGVYGVSLWLVISATAVVVAMRTSGRQRYIAAGLMLLPWLVGAILKPVDWTTPTGEPVPTALVQAGIPQDEKWLPELFEPTVNFYRRETARLASADLVVWPEVAIPSINDRIPAYIDLFEAEARAQTQTVLFGVLEREGEQIYNSVMQVGEGERRAYRKRHLVPFGEYFPVPAKVREWMRLLSLPHSDLSAGADEQPLLRTAGGVGLAVAICYEDAYAAEQLYALPEAGLLVNVSNDAWFGDSIAPHQHLQIARMRSLEVGRAGVRATNTGISAFIDADGTLLDTGAQFEPVTMRASLQPRSGSTPYVSVGNWPVTLFCGLVIAFCWLRTRAS